MVSLTPGWSRWWARLTMTFLRCSGIRGLGLAGSETSHATLTPLIGTMRHFLQCLELTSGLEDDLGPFDTTSAPLPGRASWGIPSRSSGGPRLCPTAGCTGDLAKVLILRRGVTAFPGLRVPCRAGIWCWMCAGRSRWHWVQQCHGVGGWARRSCPGWACDQCR